MYAGLLDGDEAVTVELDPNRKTYVNSIRGQFEVNGQVLRQGDAAKLEAETQLQLTHGQLAEVLVFDFAA